MNKKLSVVKSMSFEDDISFRSHSFHGWQTERGISNLKAQQLAAARNGITFYEAYKRNITREKR